jgi:hypothetical protein
MISFLMKVAIAIIDLLRTGSGKCIGKCRGIDRVKGIRLNLAIRSSGQGHLNQ